MKRKQIATGLMLGSLSLGMCTCAPTDSGNGTPPCPVGVVTSAMQCSLGVDSAGVEHFDPSQLQCVDIAGNKVGTCILRQVITDVTGLETVLYPKCVLVCGQ